MAPFKVKIVRPDIAPNRAKSSASSESKAELSTQYRVHKATSKESGAIPDINSPTKKPVTLPKNQAKAYSKIVKNRRPSIEIAKSFVELNLKTVIDVENAPKLTKKEIRQMRKQEKKENRRRFRKLKIFMSFMLLLLIAVGIAGLWWQTSTRPVNPEDTGSYRFEVARGATSTQVADALVNGGFIKNSLAFRIYARWSGNIIQAGTHMLSPSYTLQEISEKLTMSSTEEISIQIPPGLDLGQLRDVFRRAGFSNAEIDRALNADYDNEILRGRPEGATLEGYVFPETYRIFAGDNLEALIQRSLDELERVVEENDLKQRFAYIGMTFHEGLTLASIVTLEVRSSEEQQKVASVFLNKLSIGDWLGADPTFRYAFRNGLCDVNGPSCNSVFNTRFNVNNTLGRPGVLPPSPIANVGAQALIATANPAATDYFFFVSGDDGITRFSRTVEEHERLVVTYCRELCLL